MHPPPPPLVTFLAGVAVVFLALPLLGLVARAPWSRLGAILASGVASEVAGGVAVERMAEHERSARDAADRTAERERSARETADQTAEREHAARQVAEAELARLRAEIERLRGESGA